MTAETAHSNDLSSPIGKLRGTRAAVLLHSCYPADPRPRRAAEALAEAGVRVDVICARNYRHEPLREVINGVNVVRIPLKKRRASKFTYVYQYSVFIFASAALLFFRSFRRRYHFVHAHNMPDILVFAALFPRLLGAKIVIDLHDPMPELMMTIFGIDAKRPVVRLLKFLEKISVGFAHAVITVNKTCARIFASRSCKSEKVTVVMNSPDERIFALRNPATPVPRPADGRPFVLMYHGSLVERNGLALAVDAVHRLRSMGRNVELRVYGDSTPYLESVLETTRTNGDAEVVHFHGPQTLDGIVAAIDKCDLGIIPNLRNIFTEINTPTRIFEFLSRGKPVVAPATPGILECFSPDELLTFPSGDAAQLATQVAFAIDQPAAVGDILHRGQEVYRRHRWSEERKTFLAFFASLRHGASACPSVPSTESHEPRS